VRLERPGATLGRVQKPHIVDQEHSKPEEMVRRAEVCSTMHSLHTAVDAVEGGCMVEDHWAVECVARDDSAHLASA
jgi:hypothetical protein